MPVAVVEVAAMVSVTVADETGVMVTLVTERAIVRPVPPGGPVDVVVTVTVPEKPQVLVIVFTTIPCWFVVWLRES